MTLKRRSPKKNAQSANTTMKLLKQLMDGEVHLYNRLLKQKIYSDLIVDIHIHGSITSGLMNIALTQLHAGADAFMVRVHINSCGGLAHEAFHLFAALKAHPANLRNGVKAYISGTCMSAALIVAMGCTKRVARPDAVFLHHSAHGGSKASVRQVNEAIDNVLKVCADRDGRAAFDTLKRRGNRNQPFAAFEAKALNIVDEIDDFEPWEPSDYLLEHIDNAEYLENPEEFENKPKRAPVKRKVVNRHQELQKRANAWADRVVENGIPTDIYGFPSAYFEALAHRMPVLFTHPTISLEDVTEFRLMAIDARINAMQRRKAAIA